MRAVFVFVIRVSALVALWLLAWGDASLSRVLTGIVLAIVVLVAFPTRVRHREPLHIAPVALVELGGYVVWQLVVSNLLVAREVATPGSKVRTGVLAHRLDGVPDIAKSLIANIIALTPGTMTVELTRRPEVIYVHFLLLDDVDDARASIDRLQSLVTRALYRRPIRSAGETST